MAEAVTAGASVSTDAPARYAKQLASHLGRRSTVVEEEAGTRIVMQAGSCLLQPVDGSLELRAQAADEEGLGVVMDVVGRHLERFGQRNELVVAWTRP